MGFDNAPGVYYPNQSMGYDYSQQAAGKQPFMNEPFHKEYEKNEGYPFAAEFPRALDYSNEEEIMKALPHYKEINSSGFDPDKIAHAHFFILRSTNDDDIHKVIRPSVPFFSHHIFDLGYQILSLDEFPQEQRDPFPNLERKQLQDHQRANLSLLFSSQESAISGSGWNGVGFRPKELL